VVRWWIVGQDQALIGKMPEVIGIGRDAPCLAFFRNLIVHQKIKRLVGALFDSPACSGWVIPIITVAQQRGAAQIWQQAR
jgi:hypothetical protein